MIGPASERWDRVFIAEYPSRRRLRHHVAGSGLPGGGQTPASRGRRLAAGPAEAARARRALRGVSHSIQTKRSKDAAVPSDHAMPVRMFKTVISLPSE